VPQQSYLEVNGKRVKVSNLEKVLYPAMGFTKAEAFLDHFDLQSFPKTSGSKGLQIYVPLNTKASYDVTKPFAHTLAEHLKLSTNVNEHQRTPMNTNVVVR
jgi:DNA primase